MRGDVHCWTERKLHHDTCIHQIRMGDGSWKECGVTITEYVGRPNGWLCPMHERQVWAATKSLTRHEEADVA